MSNGDDEDEEQLTDSEWPDEAEERDSADTEPCLYCGKPVYEGAELCPHCGNYISVEDAPRRKSLWIVVGVVVCLAVILLCWVL